MESDLLGFHLPVLDIDFVTNQADWNVLAYSHKVLVPLRDILVGDASAHIEHDDTTVTANANNRIHG